MLFPVRRIKESDRTEKTRSTDSAISGFKTFIRIGMKFLENPVEITPLIKQQNVITEQI